MINKIPIDIQINFVFNFFTVFIGVKYRILLTIMYVTLDTSRYAHVDDEEETMSP